YYCNLEVNSELNVKLHQKTRPPRFGSFLEYRQFLFTGVRKIGANGADPARKIKYQAATTISSGYDSSCCAVLAREIGCAKAFTLIDARDDEFRVGNDISDDGDKVARALGLQPIRM